MCTQPVNSKKMGEKRIWVTGDRAGRVAVWRAADLTAPALTFQCDSLAITDVVFVSASRFATTSHSGVVALWRVEGEVGNAADDLSITPLGDFKQTEPATRLAYCVSSNILAAGFWNGRVNLLAVDGSSSKGEARMQSLSVLALPASEWITGLHFSGTQLTVVQLQGAVALFDCSNPASATLTPAGILASVSHGSGVRDSWVTAGVWRGKASTGEVGRSAFAAGLVTGDSTGRLGFWDAPGDGDDDDDSNRRVHTVPAHTGAIERLLWLSNVQRLVTAGHDGSVKLWVPAGPRRVTQIGEFVVRAPCTALAVAADGAIVAGDHNGAVYFFHAMAE
jgi:WD40 repeat protein